MERLRMLLGAVLSVCGSVSLAAQISADMAVLEKWSSAKVIRYQVTGVHDARALVVFGDYEGKADVSDRIAIDLVWDTKTRKPVGEVKITDSKTQLKNLKSDGTNCAPPSLQGEYEHFQALTNSVTSGSAIEIKGVRTFPAARVSQYPASCSQRAIPGGKEPQTLYVTMVEPTILGLPIDGSNKNMSIAADRKSFTIKGAGNWVWTYIPTVVR